jgi:predicted nucleic acid-binding protein
VKLAVSERESEALARYVAEPAAQVSSVLAAVELRRAAERVGGDRPKRLVERLLAHLDLIWLDHSIVMAASELAPVGLRAIDSVHVATALSIGRELETFISYDRRQLAAAEQAGLSVASPGS